MRTFGFASILLLFAAGPLPAQNKLENLSQDVWETVFARDAQGRDQQIGFAHLLVEPITVDKQDLLRSTRELRLTIRRDGHNAELKATTGTEETLDGTVVGVFMKQWIGEKQAMTMNGKVDADGKKVKLSVAATVKNDFQNPWDAKVLGLSREATLLRDKKVKPGDSFSYKIFEPSISHIATIQVSVKDLEDVLLPRGGKKKLLRVESTPEKIQDVQLPGSIIWFNPETNEPVMTQINMPGLGLLTLQRSTKEVAMGPLGAPPDLMKLQTIRLGQRIGGNVNNLLNVTYVITFTGNTDPNKLVKADDRQTIEKIDDKSFKLTVEARRSPRKLDKEAEAAEEFIKSNLYINSDDEQVKKLARGAVGKLEDPWEKAKAIERWVRANMKSVNYTEAMATADHVAKTLSGDCSEYSMLAAAMCRAEGIPSRTALGLVYVDNPTFGGPALAFHMWTEVFVKGQWLAIDATLGQGVVGPGHIKITDHSWHQVRGFNPLLPVTGFILAKPTVEIKGATKD